MAYGPKVLDHYENPRNVGVFPKDDTTVGTGMVGAPACGDVMRLQIKVVDDLIVDAKIQKHMGVVQQSQHHPLLTEMVKGMSLDEASEIKNIEIVEELALPPVKIHCSVLAEDCIKAAIINYKENCPA